MKIFIITDLEGAAMVSRFKQTHDWHDTPELRREAMQLLTGEINAAVDGILDAYPKAEVVVWDGHGSGGIDIMSFHPRAKLIARGPIKPPFHMDSSFDALYFVGQHAMAGTENAPLCHTYSATTVDYYKLNGRKVGEFGARAIMAGTLGVPTVFMAGDDKAAIEARELVPKIHTAVVKEGLGLELALHLAPQAAHELIRETAAAAARDVKNIPPVVVEPPYELEIRVRERANIGGYLARGAEKIDDRTIVKRSNNICDLSI